MVRFLRCLVLAQISPKLHHKEAKRRFIVSIAVSYANRQSQVTAVTVESFKVASPTLSSQDAN